MNAFIGILGMLAQTLSMIVIIWFILGLLFAFNVIGRDNHFLVQVEHSISSLLAPLLNPIRRIMPNTGAIDFSPMVLLLLINAVMIVLAEVARG
ncbi:YggT family protein [Pontixanthobacter aquaemixtae]|uniref:YggT family protein n=1 Tax=Pontixanthobacter aquaemixtae TaxID=1958940 RepID=A0A844ZW53_9SPHN|nr:YggT family protein [Pontixanthobacter aquaemixtae]MXO91684.1 YggT family protein [Pontixanthobacter aquaemixtae]